MKVFEEGKIEVLFLRYEEMKKDNVILVIYKFVEFIGVELYDVEEILRVINFIKMKEKFN